MKIIVTTSNAYAHIVPVFSFLYNKYWGAPFELVGYDPPAIIPDNCTFVSLGKQGDKKEFSSDIRGYFSAQPQHFVWMMEDTFIRETVKVPNLNYCIGALTRIPQVGRIALTNNSHKEYSLLYSEGYFNVYATPKNSFYRLSLQPAIWNKDYLLKYLTPGLDPWKFETQIGFDNPKVELNYVNVALEPQHAPLTSNEGVRKSDLYKFDLNGVEENVIEEMINLKLI